MDFISLSLTYFCLTTKRSTYFMPHLTDKPPVSFLMILLSFPLRNLFLNQIWGLIIVRVVSSLSAYVFYLTIKFRLLRYLPSVVF